MTDQIGDIKIRKQELLDACRILIVEDEYVSRLVIKEIFKELGFKTVEDAENGKVGLKKARELRPHLIIMDVEMPEMDGIVCCQEIRQDPKLSDVAILVQTALDQTSDKARIFEAGADDYLTKPIDPYEITARSILHLERLMMVKKLKSYHERVQSELDMARQTQHILLPSDLVIESLTQDYSMDIQSHFKTSSELGGDFWGVRSLSNEKLAFYLVDFSGHGVNAALNTFRLHALMQNSLSVADQPGAYLTHLNTILAPLLPTGQFATMFYGVINFAEDVLSFASAAAPYPIIFRDHGASAEALKENNLPLGVDIDKTYKNRQVSFRRGDMIFLYSDALTESDDKQGEFLDIDTIVFLIQEYFGKGTDFNMKTGFAKFLNSFEKRCVARISDDLTLNAYYRRV